MTTFLLTLVRHGTTDSKRRLSKTVDCKGNTLSRRGYCQADLLGQRLKCEHFTHIYCSDVSKAKETAVVIANHNRFCSNLTINEDPRLEELRAIRLESQENHNIKDINDTILDKLETLEDIRHRAEEFFLEICNMIRRDSKRSKTTTSGSAECSQTNNVLVVSHKSLLREMLRYFSSELGCSLPRRSGRKMTNWNSSYTGVSVFRITLSGARSDDNIHVECLSLNDNSHLNRRTVSSDSDELDKSIESPS